MPNSKCRTTECCSSRWHFYRCGDICNTASGSSCVSRLARIPSSTTCKTKMCNWAYQWKPSAVTEFILRCNVIIIEFSLRACLHSEYCIDNRLNLMSSFFKFFNVPNSVLIVAHYTLSGLQV